MTALMDPVLQYIFLIAITILFTVLALNRESILLHASSAFMWFFTALIHIIIGEQTSALTSTLPFLYFGVGFIFSVSTTYKALQYLHDKKGSLDLIW